MKKIDYKKIKQEAWNITKENIASYWKPYFFILLISIAVSELSNALSTRFNTCIFSIKGFETCIIDKGTIISYPVSLLISIFTTFLTFGMYKIILSIVRHENTSFNDIFSYKKDFLKLFLLSLIITILCDIGFMFLIIPGIIISLMYSMVYYINVDKNLKIKELLKESKDLIKGYKKDYFFFQLSFIGWILLTILSLGILLIFVGPYMSFAEALYYEELKRIKSN